MSKVKIQGNASGTGVLTVTAPNTSTDRTITLPDGTGTLIADDGSGNVLVGTTVNNPYTSNVNGVSIRPSNTSMQISKDGNASLLLNRKSSDGQIVQLGKDGSAIGSIGVVNSNNPYISNDADNSGLQFGTNQILPHYDDLQRDNAVDLGSSSVRFKDLYLSNGIVFDAVTGNATSNTLDDYEEGTWTPNLSTASTSIGQVGQSGHYTKIGNVVYCIFSIHCNALNSASGMLQIHSLPFTVENVSFGSAEPSFGVITFANNLTSRDYGGGVILRVNNASTYIECKYTPGGAQTTFGGSNFNAEDISANTFMCGSFMYRTA